MIFFFQLLLLSLDKSKVFFQNNPNVHFIAEGVFDYEVPPYVLSILESHSFSEPRVLAVEMFVSMQSNVTQPSYFLRALTTENGEHLVSHMHVDFHIALLINYLNF